MHAPRTLPARLLRLEAAVLLVLALVLYRQHGEGWLLFLAVILAPDLGMLGYLVDNRFGAAAYNLCHTSAIPAVVAGYGLMDERAVIASIGLVWLAHIGMDRLLGYGLKYATAFQDTHLQRV